MRLSAHDSIPVLSDAVASILNRFSTSRTKPACVIQRSKIILMSAMGKQNKDISVDVGLHVINVGKWRTRFIKALPRLESVEKNNPEKLETEVSALLQDRQRTGAKQTFTADQRTFIITIACQDPKEHGYELSHWSLSALCHAVIAEKIAESISVASISRILNENEIQPHKIQYWLHSTEKSDDPETFKAKVQAINNAYAKAHEIASSGNTEQVRIISTDEMTGVQALEHKFPDKLPRSGEKAKMEFEYIRHGTISFTAFFDVVSGKVSSPYLNNTRNEEDFVEALDQLIKTDAEKEWIIIADNLNTHYSASLVEYVAKQIGYDKPLGKKRKSGILENKESRIAFLTNPDHRIRFLYTPKHCSWLNQIEIWFGIISRQLLKRKSYTSVDELTESIRSFVKQYNNLFAHPFNWKYSTTPLGD